MRTISSDIVKELVTTNAASHAQPAVTIYAPMHISISPSQLSQNQIRLKNLTTQAIDTIIKQYGEDNALAKELAAWLDATYNNVAFWESQTPGLLLCARAGDIRWFNLPIDTDEYMAVDETFHLAPIVAMLNENHSYYILTVTQQHPKLFQGDMYDLHFSNVELPMSVQIALGIDERNQKTENQGSARGTSLRTGGFNGRGGARNPREEDRMKFFRIIDRVICEKTEPSTPLILAGIEAETVEYRHISKHPHILKGIIAGSHADMDMDALHERAMAIIHTELVQPAHRSAIQEYEELAGTNPSRTTQDIKTIQTATEAGRVEKLLAPLENQTTDTIRDNRQPITKICLPEGEDSRQLNRLAMKIWQMSGTIVSLTPNEMPRGAALAARLRY